LWHVCDIARPGMDFRFRWKSGRAVDITKTIGFDSKRDRRGWGL
jgi:hypothetical protein